MSSWDEWDDDEPRSRRRRARDDHDLRHDVPPHSGAVTSVGVISIVMAIIFMLCGGGFGLCGLFCTGVGMAARQQGNIFPPDLLESYGGVLLGWGILHLLLGVGLLVGGIVILQRRNWARVFTIVLAGIVGALGAVQIVVFILMATGDGGDLFGNVDPEERIGQAVGGMFVALIYLAYAVFACVILLHSHYREEFD
jgi:hypothetical protein